MPLEAFDVKEYLLQHPVVDKLPTYGNGSGAARRLQGQVILIIRGDEHLVWPDDFATLTTMGTVREDPDTPHMRTCFENYTPICRVDANSADTVRCLFLDPGLPGTPSMPDLVVCRSNDTDYQRLDAGNLIHPRSATFCIEDSGALRFHHNFLPERCTSLFQRTGHLLDAVRQAYIDGFLEGRLPEIKLNGLTVMPDRFSYSDTVVEFPKGALKPIVETIKGLNHVLVDFGDALARVARTVRVRFKVNGLDLLVTELDSKSGAKLWYVNGFKISRDDLGEVIAHCLCFPNATEVYNDYLREVSRISLKFHRAMTDGMPACINPALLDLPKAEGQANLRIPGGHSGNGTVEITLKLKKVVGSASTVFLAGKLRHIANFDLFRRVLAGNTVHVRSHPNVEDVHTERRKALARWLFRLDLQLKPESRMLTADVFQDGCRTAGPEMNTKLDELCTVLSTEFAGALENEHQVLERSYTLLKEIMKETGAEEIRSPGGKYSYRVSGHSGVVYHIDEATARVTTAAGDHICIVKASNDVRGFDYIASLLMILSQDTYTASSVYTLASVLRKAKEQPQPEDGAEEQPEDDAEEQPEDDAEE